jgi:hydroxymethylpyrimidine/phosphomethylpyrimidine kinase
MAISNLNDMEEACKKIQELGCDYVLIKGGHLEERQATDILYDGTEFRVLISKSIPRDVRGSGCTFSALIGSFIALGMDVADAVGEAKLHMNIYFEGKGSFVRGFSQPEDRPGPVMTQRELEIYGALSSAVGKLPDILSKHLVPEVGINIGYALHNASSTDDVCALEGRFSAVGETIAHMGDLRFGASKHVARIILAAMRYDPQMRSAMNIRYSMEILDACSASDLSIATFDRRLEPDDISTMEWGTRTAIKRSGNVPDIIYDTGGMGKEPMIRILGCDPHDVISKLRLIRDKYDTG